MHKLVHNKALLDSTGKPLIVGLFKETALKNKKDAAPFSLADWKKVYLECADPTEYRAAEALTGDWQHWLVVRNHRNLKHIFDFWKEELEMKLKSDAVMALIEASRQPGGTAAAKYLSEHGYELSVRDKKAVGRPKKEEVIADVPEKIANKLENVLHLVAHKKAM
jgi:hypothetical protein